MEEVDVLICGGGPVGLLIAYCLARYGLSTHIVEQNDRAKQITFGRAAMIAPRTLEMIEQLGLVDGLHQIGFVVRGQIHYNKHGERVDVIRYATTNITDTFYDYLLICRQKYTEEVFHEGYRKVSNRSVHYGVKVVDFHINDTSDDYKVDSTLESQDGTTISVKSKFLIGADGGRSTVRELAGIRFEGDKTNHHFIRIDGIVNTNMPDSRTGNLGIESASHGSVLWACLDHGVTRVGFAFPEKLWDEKGASLTQEDVIREAKEALRPFTLEFESVDWWTAYSVGQRLASDYRARDRILIAGDAAHTHSSAAAQGMNTGIHDAVNLSWKLAGYIKGWFTESVLDSYGHERRMIASKIIEQDSIVALLTAGKVPKQYQDEPDFDASKTLSDIYKQNQGLNSGIGVSYPPDVCTIVEATASEHRKVSPGERAPDVLLQKPGMRFQVRLYTLLQNVGKFTILLFCGNPEKTKVSVRSWRDYLAGPNSYTRYQIDLFQHVSIVAMHNDRGAVMEKLGMETPGPAYYDVDGSAHERYGLTDDKATIVILRPDGTVGLVSPLPETDDMSAYFARFLIVKRKTVELISTSKAKEPVDQAAGEVDIRVQNGDGNLSRD